MGKMVWFFVDLKYSPTMCYSQNETLKWHVISTNYIQCCPMDHSLWLCCFAVIKENFAFVLPADNVLSSFRLNIFIVKCVHSIEKIPLTTKESILEHWSSSKCQLEKLMHISYANPCDAFQCAAFPANNIFYLYNIINRHKKKKKNSNRPPVTASFEYQMQSRFDRVFERNENKKETSCRWIYPIY